MNVPFSCLHVYLEYAERIVLARAPPSPLRVLAQNFVCEMAFRDPAGQLNMLNNIICLVRPEIDPDGKT